MANRYDIDAQSFVDNFRAGEGPPLDKRRHSGNHIPLAEEPHPKESTKKLELKGKVSKKQTDEYKSLYIDDLRFLCPPYDCSYVRICPEYVKLIRRLILLCGDRKANLTTFINNLLRQHFEDNKDVVLKLQKKYAQNLE